LNRRSTRGNISDQGTCTPRTRNQGLGQGLSAGGPQRNLELPTGGVRGGPLEKRCPTNTGSPFRGDALICVLVEGTDKSRRTRGPKGHAQRSGGKKASRGGGVPKLTVGNPPDLREGGAKLERKGKEKVFPANARKAPVGGLGGEQPIGKSWKKPQGPKLGGGGDYLNSLERDKRVVGKKRFQKREKNFCTWVEAWSLGQKGRRAPHQRIIKTGGKAPSYGEGQEV